MSTEMVCGGITKVPNPNSPHIEALARFAVDEYNKKQNATLKFGGVVDAKQQVVAGIMYYITLSATNGCLANHYEAKVLEKSWMNFKELEEFKLLKPRAH